MERRDGTVVRVLASHHTWVEFVVGSSLALRVFLQVLQFLIGCIYYSTV